MAWDYASDLASAREMILDAGRLVAFQALATAPADPDHPLRGPGAAPAPVTGIPAVFVQPSGLTKLGASATVAALFANCEQIAVVAWDGVNDFSLFDTVVDTDATVWKIEHVEKLAPGPIILLYYVGVKRP